MQVNNIKNNNSPAFGMAYIQRDVNRLFRRLPLQQQIDFNKAVGNIHKASENAGYDLIMERYTGNGYEDDVVISIFNKTNKMAGKQELTSFQDISDRIITYSKQLCKFFDTEAKKARALARQEAKRVKHYNSML